MLVMNNNASAQPAQQTISLLLPSHTAWNLASINHDNLITTMTFTPPRNSQFNPHTQIVQQIIPYANIPDSDHPNINTHNYPKLRVESVQTRCNKVESRIFQQTSHSSYFVIIGTSCSGPYSKFMSFEKVFAGVDALYVVRYDALDPTNISDKEMGPFERMIRTSYLMKNPRYQG